jgi:hypothetical protein
VWLKLKHCSTVLTFSQAVKQPHLVYYKLYACQAWHSALSQLCRHNLLRGLVCTQVGLSSEALRLRVLADLAEQVLSEALYDSLRTKQQLGYTVSSGARLTHGVTGFCVVVVSSAFDASTVEQRIEAFMHEFQHKELMVGPSWPVQKRGARQGNGMFPAYAVADAAYDACSKCPALLQAAHVPIRLAIPLPKRLAGAGIWHKA